MGEQIMRDYQRSKVYALDWKLLMAAARHPDWLSRTNLSLDDIRVMVQRAFDMKLITGGPVQVKDGRRRKSGCANKYYMKLPKFTRQAVYVLHELAHVITIRKFDDVAAHGPEYMGIYRDLLIKFEILDAETIDRLIKETGVDCSRLAAYQFSADSFTITLSDKAPEPSADIQVGNLYTSGGEKKTSP